LLISSIALIRGILSHQGRKHTIPLSFEKYSREGKERKGIKDPK
jgi:hypothetical protein